MIDIRKLLRLLANLYDGNGGFFMPHPCKPHRSLDTAGHWGRLDKKYNLRSKHASNGSRKRDD